MKPEVFEKLLKAANVSEFEINDSGVVLDKIKFIKEDIVKGLNRSVNLKTGLADSSLSNFLKFEEELTELYTKPERSNELSALIAKFVEPSKNRIHQSDIKNETTFIDNNKTIEPKIRFTLKTEDRGRGR